jgi:3-oxoacyl-[acyl-carrier-protein] synthase II
MSSRPRVIVTGIGVVSAWGWGRDAFAAGLASGATAIGGFDRIDHAAYRTHVAGQVPPPPPEVVAAVPGWRRLAWADRFAVAAGLEAMRQAGLGPRPGAAGELRGVFFGSSTGGMLEGEEWYRRVRGAGAGRAPLSLLVHQQVSSPGESLARAAGCNGPAETVSSACASGTLALGRALDALRAGEVDVALAGGADSLCRITYGGFNSLRSVDERPCRPFRAGRAGLSIGEGGAVLVLETAEHAAARGAAALATLAGAGASSDASHMTAPHPEGEGAARALREALRDAGVAAAEVGFVNAHGTGTPLNDVAEWKALQAVLGDESGRVPLTATKGAVGHLLGSAGAVEAAATVLALLAAAVQPAAGEGETDPELPVDLVRGAPRGIDLGPGAPRRAAVSLNLAFGGCNAAAVFMPPGAAVAAGSEAA